MNLNVIVAGIISGLLYGLCGISLVIVYRASRLINFALGGMGGLAAYLVFTLLQHQIPYIVGYVVALAVGGAIGWAAEWFVVRRLTGKQHIIVGIATLGILEILQGIMVLVWGTDTQALPVPFGSGRAFALGSVVLSSNEVFILCLTCVCFLFVYVLLFHTRLGLRMRAVAEGATTAAIVGVNVRSVSQWSWSIAGVAGALAALLVIPATNLSPQSFTDFLFLGFAAVVLGGLTSASGVVVGGIVFGVAINIFAYTLSTRLTNTLSLIFVTVVLLLRPQGVLGIVEKSVSEPAGLKSEGFDRGRYGALLARLRSHVGQRLRIESSGRPDMGGDSDTGGTPARKAKLLWFALPLLLLLVLPYVTNANAGLQADLPSFAGSILGVLGLTVLYGVCGFVSVGNGAFLAIGAYTAAILIDHAGVPFWLALPAAAVVCFIAGGIVGLPALRVRGYVYFSVYTFMVANTVPELIDFFSKWTGGEDGLPLLAPALFSGSAEALYWFLLVISLLICGLVALLLLTRLGRRWRAVRDSTAGAAAAGINVRMSTVLAFAVSAALTGMGGVLSGAAVGVLSPESYSIWTSIYLLVGVVVGGAGLVWGAVVGAALITFVPYLAGTYPSISPDLVYGIVLVVIIAFAPGGLIRAGQHIARSSSAALRSLAGMGGRKVAGRAPDTVQARLGDTQAREQTAEGASVPQQSSDRRPELPVARVAPVSAAAPGDRPVTDGRDPLLVMSSFTVAYDELVAVRDVNITVGRGEVIALIGPNGAGKSSILRGISGVARVRTGSAMFLGRELVGLRPWEIARRGIAHVVEGRGIFPGLTVEQNLSLGAMVSSSALAHREADQEMVYSLFPELRSRRQQSGGSLSGGQQQMLAIARGIMAQPSLLILDEPSLGLSPLLAAIVFEKLAAMKELGTAMIIVEQNSALACEVADRLYLLRAGHVRRECDASDAGSLEDLMGAYLGTVEEEGKIS